METRATPDRHEPTPLLRYKVVSQSK